MEFKVLSVNGDEYKHQLLADWLSTWNENAILKLDHISIENPMLVIKLMELKGVEGYSLIILDLPTESVINAIVKFCERMPSTLVFSSALLIGDFPENFITYANEDFSKLLAQNRINLEHSVNRVRNIATLDIEALNNEGLFPISRMEKKGSQSQSAKEENSLLSMEGPPLEEELNGTSELNAMLNMADLEQDETDMYTRVDEFYEEFAPNADADSLASIAEESSIIVTTEKEVTNDSDKAIEMPPVTSETVDNNTPSSTEKDSIQVEKNSEEEIETEIEDDEQEQYHLPLQDFSRAIQKRLINQEWNEHKTVAVWSPLGRMGVTSFVINLACFLAENRMYTSVLEGVRSNVMLRHTLQRYMKQPTNWKSYASCIRETKIDANGNISIDPQEVAVEWEYRDVKFIPLDVGDIDLNWSQEMLQVYLKMPQLMDVTLIDLPSGEMNEITYATLVHVDTLFILVDDAFQEILAWKEYIHYLKEYFDLDVQLIFNKAYPFSDVKMLESKMELNVLAKIPSLHEQIMHNYYHNRPILYNKNARTQLFPPFEVIAKHLVGENFKLYNSVDSYKPSYDISTWRQFSPRNIKSLLHQLFALLKQSK